MTAVRAIVLLLALCPAGACRETPHADAAELRTVERARQDQLAHRLAIADANPNRTIAVAKWYMPEELKEISGLTLTSDGKLLTHDDNVGRIYEIDPRTGVTLKSYYLGTGVRGDFESITTGGGYVYLLTSDGLLYQFRDGPDGAGVPFNTIDTGLGDQCELESMVYQKDSDWLVMPCKKAKDKKFSGELVIYRWRLHGPAAQRLSVQRIPIKQVRGTNDWKNLHPSDITIDPTTGNYVIITSHEKALVELTPTGQLVRASSLPPGHNQPEGVAITRDGILIISDEENRTPAAITLYRWRP